jgi:hypothetical protein
VCCRRACPPPSPPSCARPTPRPKQQLEAALAEKTKLGADLTSSRGATEDLKADIASLVAALPPDPRDNGVEVRAGRFSANGRTLDYDVVLTRERSATKPFNAVLQWWSRARARRAPAR